MNDDGVVIYRTLTLHIDDVTTTAQILRYAGLVASEFDNGVQISVFVDSDTGTLVVEQTIV